MVRRFASSSCVFLLSILALVVAFGLSGCGGGTVKVTIVKPSSTTIDPGDSITLTVTVANDSAGVTWSLSGTGCTGSGCGTLTNATATSVTYTAPSASQLCPECGVVPGSTDPRPMTAAPSPITVTITATAKDKSSVTSSVTLTIPQPPSISTASGALTAGQVGSAYTDTIAVTGGISPYTWTVTDGNLPTGLTIGASTGAISGIPTASGTYNFTLKVADSGSPALTATSQFSIAVSPAPAIVFSTTSLASATYNVAYSASVAATGGAGALTYAVTTGSLPAGLAMSSAGAIIGTPTAAGTANFTVTASDAYGDSAQQNLSITVNYPAIAISPGAGALPGGQYKVAYSQTLSATGGSGTGYTWSVVAGAPSLAAVNLSVSSSGAITGTPQAIGTASFTVQVKDSYGDEQESSFSIAVTYPALTITTSTLPSGMVGVSYGTVTLNATGGSGSGYAWSVTSGTALSATGLTLSTGGLINGTPTTAESAASVTVQVEDSASNKASATLSLTVFSALTITSTTLPNATYGTAYTTNLAATGGDGSSLTWSTTSGSALTAVGLSLTSAGVLSGTPPSPQNSPLPNCQAGKAYCLSLSVTVADSDNSAFTTTASVALTLVYPTLTITPTTLPSGTTGTSYSQTLTASGGSGKGYTWSTTGSNTLASIALSFSAGTVSGSSPTSGAGTFTAVVTDSLGDTAQATYTINIYSQLTVTTTTLPSGDAGAAYSAQLQAGGGTGTSFTWSVTVGSLPGGLTLNPSTGAITGTPTAATNGGDNFTVQVKDSGGNTATQALTIVIYLALSQNATALPLTGTTSVSYSGTITGVGGSGNYSWTVTGLSDSLTQSATGGTLTISGTPGSATTVAMTVKLTDTTTSAFVSDNYSIVISAPQPLTLPAPNPTSLGSATVNQSYSGAINAAGGVGPFTWKINEATVNGSGVSLGSGLTATNTGGNTLSISGTPTATGPVSLTNVTVTDSESTPVTAGPDTYTIQVNSAGSEVSGQISLNNNCGGSGNQPLFTVTINTTPQQQTTTDSNGNYSFASVPNGTYTITPSISGASSSLFYPVNSGVTVNNASVSGQNFRAEVGYTISGAVSYSATGTPQTGQTYLALTGGCMGNGEMGTSISETTLTSGGAYTIRGVPPGTYTVEAWMDPLGQSVQNAIDPTGSAALSVTDANVGSVDVTMHDPTFTTPTQNPQIQGIIPNSQGVVIEYNDSQNGSGIEDANAYLVQWSTSPTLGGGSGGGQFASIAGSYTFTARGNTNVWVLTNATLSGSGFSFTSGQTYYFQARSFNSLDTSSPHPSGWCNYTSSGCNGVTGFIGVTIGTPACTGTCTQVSSSVTIPNSIAIKAGAPLYLGLVQLSGSGGSPTGIYVIEMSNPANGPNDFTVTVPSGSNYAVVGILDQNNNGGFDAGTVSNTNNNLQANLTISGSTQTVPGITLPTSNSTALVATEFQSLSCQGCGSTPSESYQLNFQVSESDKLPVAVVLNSGPNVLNNNGTVALDMGLCTYCGNPQFDYSVSLLGTPKVGDTYSFTVTYSDGSTDTGTAVSTAVTGWNSGSSVVGAADAPSGLSPTDNSSTSTTPTFTWTDPASSLGANFYYSFYIYNQSTNCSGNCNIWQIPGNNSNSNGFSSSITSITWGTDPTGGGSTPTVGSLTSGDIYNWTVQVQDQNGNQAQTQVWYQP